jgi:hypothetical protein
MRNVSDKICREKNKTRFELDNVFNRLNAELNPIFHLLALLGAHHILHVSRVRVNMMQVMR